MFFSPPLSSSSLPGASVNYITVTARQAMFAEFSDGDVSVKQPESERGEDSRIGLWLLR